MGTAPASASEAMEMVHAGLGWLAAADATQLGAETQARCLRMLEQADAMGTAARASVLAAFTSGQGYSADADYSPRAWLMHKTGVTRGAAAGHTAWARRAAAHPQVAAALAAKEMSESFGRTICQWTDKLPGDCQPAADAILVTAARAGMDLRDLGGLAAELYERSRPDLLPERAGQPVKVWVHIPLAELLEMDGSTTLVKEWVTAMRAAWAAHRAAASEGGGDIWAWLDGDAARAVACDAAIAPVVTGEVNPAALDDMVRLCVQLDKLRHGASELGVLGRR